MAGTNFERAFGGAPEVRGEAPGRVNLIGEHTDYSGGFVLPLAIPQACVVDLRRLAGRLARVCSANFERDGVLEFTIGKESRRGQWLDYVQGVTQAAAANGWPLSGFEMAIASDVPVGAGLSSSAALEVATLRALRSAFAWSADDVSLARTARVAENGFVGAPVGIMDQMAASLAGTEAALFLDTRSLDWRNVAIPRDAEIAVVDSGIGHRHAGGEYRTRRAEVDRAAALLGVADLRELFESGVREAPDLPPPLDRRVRHVLSENQRVRAMVAALEASDLAAAGELLRRSHRSLRDDFDVSIPELDLLEDLANGIPSAYGARMTGGGFGGSIVILGARGAVRDAAEETARSYESVSGRPAIIHLPLPGETVTPRGPGGASSGGRARRASGSPGS